MKIGFEFDVIEAVVSPENENRPVIEELLQTMQDRHVDGVVTEIVLAQVEKLANYQQETFAKILEAVHFEQLLTTDLTDNLAEDYLMYGVIHRRNKKFAQNIAAYASNGVILYVTLNYNQLGKYMSRKTITNLNQKRKATPIDMGSPTHALHVLSKPDFVQAVHQAQDEVYQEKSDPTIEEEIVKTRRRARRLIWDKKKSG